MAVTARSTSTDELTALQNLTAHGFVVGDLIIYDGAWVLAKADSLAHCAGTVMVSIVPTVDTFYVTQTGFVNNLPAGFTPGVQYYLSPAGGLTATRPMATGQVILPCFVAIDTSTGFFYGGSGELIQSSIVAAWNVVTTTPITMTVNNGYIANGGSSTTFVLPATYAVGDEFSIVDHSGNGFVITQTLGGVSQQVFDLGLASTAGATGSTTTTVAGQSITLVAAVANAALRVIENKGSFIYA